jgi:4-hydroxybenzoate polyprenyltransferase
MLVLAASAVYFWLYAYGFCVTNQLTAVEEDRVNKPFRPLVTGLSSLRGARFRAVAVLLAFPLFGWLLGVAVWALAWVAASLLHNIARWARWWWSKNLIIGVGTLLELAPAWQMAAGWPDVTGWRWIGTLSVVLLLVPLQDLRDVVGDRTTGRATCPMVFGERATRAFLTVGFLVLPVAADLLLFAPSGAHPAVRWPMEAALAAVCLVIAGRVTLLRGAVADDRTYVLWQQWYTGILLAAVVLL